MGADTWFETNLTLSPGRRSWDLPSEHWTETDVTSWLGRNTNSKLPLIEYLYCNKEGFVKIIATRPSRLVAYSTRSRVSVFHKNLTKRKYY
jgi:hypothetical protein